MTEPTQKTAAWLAARDCIADYLKLVRPGVAGAGIAFAYYTNHAERILARLAALDPPVVLARGEKEVKHD